MRSQNLVGWTYVYKSRLFGETRWEFPVINVGESTQTKQSGTRLLDCGVDKIVMALDKLT
jgi:hypothetical protein